MGQQATRFERIERAIFSWPYKYIESTAGKKELYDLSKDPNEKENLYLAENGISMVLEGRINKWLKANAAETESPSKSKISRETIDRLKALGYIQ